MSYSHFLLLAQNLDRCERERAYYVALAFNDPKRLSDGPPSSGEGGTSLSREQINRMFGGE